MILNICPCTNWSFVYHFGPSVYSRPLPTFNWTFLAAVEFKNNCLKYAKRAKEEHGQRIKGNQENEL